jgi:hypothetical protein
VPANHSEQEARKFAAALAGASRIWTLPTLALMGTAFWPGGSQELQRNPQWGIPPNSFVRAYTSGASDHFGHITAAAGLPREMAGAFTTFLVSESRIRTLILTERTVFPG